MFEMIESFASSICFQSLWFLTSRGLFKIAETAPHSSCALEYMGKSSSVFAMQPSSARLMPRGTRDAGRGMRDAGRGARDAGRGMRDAGRGMWDAGRGTRDAGRGTRDAGRGARDAGRDEGFRIRD